MIVQESMPAMSVVGKLPAPAAGRPRCWGRIGVAAVVISIRGLTSQASETDTPGQRAHEPLGNSPELSWAALINHTLTEYPRFAELVALDAEALALADRGRQRLAGQPSVMARYQTDGVWDDNWLVFRDDGLGFSRSIVHGYSARHDHLRIAEQFSAALAEEFTGTDLHSWVIPLLAGGDLPGDRVQPGPAASNP